MKWEFKKEMKIYEIYWFYTQRDIVIIHFILIPA